MPTLLPDPQVLLFGLVIFFIFGLLVNSVNRLILISLGLFVLHFTVLIVVPYFLYFSQNPEFPGDLAASCIVGYAVGFTAAVVGYGVRVVILRLLGRATS